ncbi:MAG: ATP-grasp domain-containing protein [Planctomycetota bacterium]|nr:MAG: ATP-grasp domain-containing protein [Planctomycetota bacterium]
MKKYTGSASMFGAGRGRRQVRILFTCAGRRVELIRAFMRAASPLGIKIVVHTADADPSFAASCIAHHTHLVPTVDSPGYIPALLKIVEKNKIDLLIPLIDTELYKLARAREKFARLSCAAIISSPRVVKICQDKLLAYDFLARNGIDTPKTWSYQQILNQHRYKFPYFLKPRKGSASKGNFILHNKTDLHTLAPRVPDAIVQEFVPGDEHTLDVYTGLDGRPRSVVPRKRVEVRGGEVTRALTVNHPGIIETGFKVAEALGECVGVITIQLFLAFDGRIRVIEINPRFGGGVPLAIRAGANFPKWILAEWLGRKPRIREVNFKAGLMMLRYHQAFFKQTKATKTQGRRT